MATTDEQQHGSVYQDDHRGQLYWWATWVDHAGRVIRRRLAPVEGTTKRTAMRKARAAADEYIANHTENLSKKRAMTRDELVELAQNASFPREPVARIIARICERIARAEDLDDRNIKGRPGLQLFADRSGISPRECHRIVEDRERIRVGADAVDRICCEFDMLLDEFIEEAFAWADRKGDWKRRPGTQDAWPVGYTTSTPEKYAWAL